MTGMNPDDRKMRELILLVASESANDSKMGAVKLNKALFHIDFAAFRDLGRPITGQPYRRLPEGPAPVELTRLRADLFREHAAHLEQRPSGMRNPMDVIVADREPDMSLFSEEELELIRRVLEGMRYKTGTTLSAESHELIGWQTPGADDEIPYASAYFAPADQTDIDRGVELAQQHGW